MSDTNVRAAKEWLKKMAVRVAEAVVISTVAEKVAPTAKIVGGKVLDKLSSMQGRKNVEELDELAKKAEESKPVKTSTIETPTETSTSEAAADGTVEAKFG